MARTHLPWKIQPKTPHGPLSEERINQLSEQFRLPRDKLGVLNANLARALDPWLFMPSVIKIVQQMQLAPKEFEQLLRDLRQAEKYLGKAHERLQSLRIHDGSQDTAFELDYREGLTQSYDTVKTINEFFARLAKSNTAEVNFTGDPDKRRNRDDRRDAVLWAVFRCWFDGGRHETVTSDGTNSQRKGPLFDFAHAVVGSITEPAAEIPGETIWKELQSWQRYNRGRRRDMNSSEVY